MTITAPIVAKRMAEVTASVRAYMRDFPELNRLITGQESSDRQIQWAIMDTLDEWNATPPFLGKATLRNMPPISMLRDGIAAYLIESVAILQTRNEVSFSDGGLTVQIAPARANLQISALLRERFLQKMGKYKDSQNIEAAMDVSGTNSELYYVNDGYFYYGVSYYP